MSGFSGFIAGMRGDPEDGPDVFQRALMARDTPDEPYDDDERQANLLGRGYAAGLVSDLSRRLGDTLAELEEEQEKIAAGERRAEQVAAMLSRGQISAMDASARMDGDFGDAATLMRLERRCDSLRGQIGEVSQAIAPPEQRALDPVQAAASRAHRAFVESTRSKMAEAQARRPARRPFVSRSAVTEPAPPDYGEITRVYSPDGMGQLGTLSGEIVR